MQVGIYTLGDIAITTAQTYVGEWFIGFGGCRGIGMDLLFAYGSSGTSGKIYVQTSLRQATATTDPGVDLLCMTFTTATKARLVNLESVTSTFLTPTDGAIADDSVIAAAILGDRFRVKVVTLGTYASQTVMSTRIAVR